MRLASIRYEGGVRIGVVKGDTVVVMPEAAGTVDAVVRGHVSLESLAATGRPQLGLDELDIGPPIRQFNRDVLCTGWNFWDHFAESGGKRQGQDPAERPSRPTFFTKAPDTAIGPRDDIAFDEQLSQQWDYEAELAVVIGKAGRSIREADALRHVFGYIVANDVSLRDMQREHGGQWFKGKSVDGTMPIGPWITTADEVDDPHELRIRCILNGEVVQDATARQMAFSIPELIAALSRGMTLHAGDVLLTGTPPGVGNGREPQLFLKHGDQLTTIVSGLGELRNTVTRRRLV